MEASGSTPSSARVFRKFDKSYPHHSPPPSPYSSLASRLPLSLIAHIDRPSERRNFLVVPISRYSQGILGWDPIYYIPRAFLLESLYRHSSCSDLDPPFASSAPFASLHGHSRTTYFAAHLRESVVGHDLDAVKGLAEEGEGERKEGERKRDG